MSLFHRPVAFWSGCLLICAGVLSHGPMFLMGQHTHWQMVGMPMTLEMWVGMALIPLGLGLSWLGLRPPPLGAAGAPPLAAGHFHVADDVALNRQHLQLVVVLVVTLAIDVMKPATLGFVMPGMSREYDIERSRAGLLALFALTGTTVGSVAWGRMADIMGRRAAILLSALMFIGTAICGATPEFEWNLAMCFLMGTSAGYLLAAGAAAWLEPLFSWRVLWLLGLPTGAVILLLNRFIPESPRFLWASVRHQQALQVPQRFAGIALLGFFDHLVASALMLAVPMALSALMLARSGIETRGVRLEEIQASLRG